MKSSFYSYFIIGAVLITMGCKKFVQVAPPPTELVGSTVYSSDATAESALNSIYLSMGGTNGPGGSVGGGEQGISALLGLSADEFSLYANSSQLLGLTYTNALTSAVPAPIWDDLYSLIYQANSAIAGITASSGMSSTVKEQLIGEAEFIRAFCNFYLVNIYGPIPIVTSTSYQENQTIARSPVNEVYQAIITDLKSAESALPEGFMTAGGGPSSERVRPNKGAARAMLARAYLFTDSMANAEAAASAVIDDGNYSLVYSLDSVFLAGSQEAIWQLEIPNDGYNTPDGYAFLLNLYGGPSNNYPFILSDSLVYGFAPGDLRAQHWVDSIALNGVVYYFPYKYKLGYTGSAPAEYPMVLRLAEQYLIRAEARAQQGNLAQAAVDLDTIRLRAGLGPVAYITQQDLLDSIYRERRFELFTEYGHRWLDLIRTGTVGTVMSVVAPQKGGSWTPTDTLYPLPLGEIQTDPKLTQNPGYN